MAVDFLQFTFQFILAAALLRLIQMKLLARNPADPFGKALALIH